MIIRLELSELEANALEVAMDHFQEFWEDVKSDEANFGAEDGDLEKYSASMELIEAVRAAVEAETARLDDQEAPERLSPFARFHCHLTPAQRATLEGTSTD